MTVSGYVRRLAVPALAAAGLVCSLGVAAAASHPVVKTLAGNGTFGYSGDGHRATAAELALPSDAEPLPHGGFLIADKKNHAIRKVSPRGRITTVAGTGVSGYNGDGIPAKTAELSFPAGVTPLPHGGFLIADFENNRVRKVDRNGIIHTVAGTGTPGFSGDGHSAKHAELDGPARVALLAHGAYLIADFGNYRIRKVDRHGNIHTVAGDGIAGSTGNGGPARQAEINEPANVAPLARGGFLISEYGGNFIRKVSPSGVIHKVAGTGTPGYNGDGILATHAELNQPAWVQPAGRGFLIADYSNNRIRRVDRRGKIHTFAGTGVPGFNGDGHRRWCPDLTCG